MVNHSSKLGEVSQNLWEQTSSLLTKSGAPVAADAGVHMIERAYWFILKYFTYDNVTKEYDYPVRKSFEKIYTATESLLVMFPKQIFLS